MLKELIRPYYLRWLYFKAVPGSRPPYFADCWRYPSRSLGAADLEELLPPPGRACDIVWFPMTDWHARMQRTQHLARALVGMGHRGIYVNPHMGRQFPTTPLFDPGHRVSRLEPNLLELHVRLPLEPVFHHRMLRPAETAALAVAVEALLDRMGSPRAAQVVSLPTWLDAAVRLRERRGWPIVYDCHDLLSGFSNMASALVAAEERLFAEAALVIFSSRTLQARHPEVAGKSRLAPNGVDAERFSPAPPRAKTRPLVAGYVGAIEEWFDVEAVRGAALANPECRFILAGRIESAGAAQLKALPNVEMPGEIAYEKVPALLREFDIGLIPFLVNDLTRAADPIKLYEYFACGLPVVSSRLPEVEPYGDLVYLASGAKDFAAAVRAALAEDDRTRRAKRIAAAARRTWNERAKELTEEIGRL